MSNYHWANPRFGTSCLTSNPTNLTFKFGRAQFFRTDIIFFHVLGMYITVFSSNYYNLTHMCVWLGVVTSSTILSTSMIATEYPKSLNKKAIVILAFHHQLLWVSPSILSSEELTLFH